MWVPAVWPATQQPPGEASGGLGWAAARPGPDASLLQQTVSLGSSARPSLAQIPCECSPLRTSVACPGRAPGPRQGWSCGAEGPPRGRDTQKMQQGGGTSIQGVQRPGGAGPTRTADPGSPVPPGRHRAVWGGAHARHRVPVLRAVSRDMLVTAHVHRGLACGSGI